MSLNHMLGKFSILQAFHTALLIFPIIVVLIVSITFILGGRCACWQWWTGVALAQGVGLALVERRRRFNLLCFFALSLLFLWFAGGVLITYGCYDAAWYHFPIVRLLLAGWNPVWQGSWDVVAGAYGVSFSEVRPWMVLSMPKGVWYFNTAAYYFIRNPFNLSFPLSPVLFLSLTITLWRRFKGIGVVAFVALVCVLCGRIVSYHAVVDCAVGLSGIGLLFAMKDVVEKDAWNWLELLAYSFWMCTAKQTAMFHCALFWSVLIACLCVRRRWSIVRKAVLLGGLLIVSIVVTCTAPYLTQWVNYGHPLYPVCTTDEQLHPRSSQTSDFLHRNEDAAAMSHLGACINAYLCPQVVHSYYRHKLNKANFCPDCEVWNQMTDHSQGTPTAPLFRWGIILSLLILALCGGVADWVVAMSVLLAMSALPTEMIGYLRYVPWSFAIELVAIECLLRVHRPLVVRVCKGFLIVVSLCAIPFVVLVYVLAIDKGHNLRRSIAQDPPKVIFYDSTSNETSPGNLRLLTRQISQLAGCEVMDNHGTNLTFGACSDGSFYVDCSYAKSHQDARAKILQVKGRREKLIAWTQFFCKTCLIALPESLVNCLTHRY